MTFASLFLSRSVSTITILVQHIYCSTTVCEQGEKKEEEECPQFNVISDILCHAAIIQLIMKKIKY